MAFSAPLQKLVGGDEHRDGGPEGSLRSRRMRPTRTSSSGRHRSASGHRRRSSTIFTPVASSADIVLADRPFAFGLPAVRAQHRHAHAGDADRDLLVLEDLAVSLMTLVSSSL
jgi:hypothetical protein